MQNRVFFPQAALDQWLADGTVDLRGTELTILAEARRYRIVEAVRELLRKELNLPRERVHTERYD